MRSHTITPLPPLAGEVDAGGAIEVVRERAFGEGSGY